VGSTLALMCTVGALVSRDRSAQLLAAAPVFGYGFAWFSHFVYEKNHPASWTWPLWSFMVCRLGRIWRRALPLARKRSLATHACFCRAMSKCTR